MQKEAVDQFASEVAPFDLSGLLSSMGGLQLLPRNASRTIRLEAMANVVAESANWKPGKPTPSRTRLDRLCNASLLARELAIGEDPFDNCFVESFPFFGRAYTVLPGTVEEATDSLARLCLWFFGRTAMSNTSYYDDAYGATCGMLAVIDAVAQKAGLSRDQQPDTSPRTSVDIPFAAELAALKAAVKFSDDELSAILDIHNLGVNALKPFIASGPFNGPISNEPHEEGWLNRQPIVQTAPQEYVVAAPGLMLSAIRDHLIELAEVNNVLEILSTNYSLAVWNNVRQNLNLMGWKEDRLAVKDAAYRANHQAAFFRFDTDKLAYVQLLTDDLHNYGESVFDGQEILDDLLAAGRAAESYGYSLSNAPNEVFHLLLFAFPRRSMMFGLPHDDGLHSRSLALSAADLESIRLIGGTGNLSLWQYAGASERVRETTRIIAFGELPEYDLYRKHHSYYYSDDARPTHLVTGLGGAGHIRREIQAKWDRHVAPAFDGTGIVEVFRLERDPEIPIYESSFYIGSQACLLVELEQVSVWIGSPPKLNADYWTHYSRTVETLAYWIWQSSNAAREAFAALPTRLLTIHVEIEDPDRWSEPGHPTSGPVAAYEVTSSHLHLLVSRNFILECYKGDNSGERNLIRIVLEGLSSLAASQQGSTFSAWTEFQVEQIVDSVAPLGLKKKLLVLDPALNPEVDPANIPPYRQAQEHDYDALLDDLDSFLLHDKGLTQGQVRDDERTAVLRDVVSYYFSRLESQVASLDAKDLLNWLIAHNEAVVRQEAFRVLTTATKLECYRRQSEFLANLKEETAERTTASVAIRFLLEYVVARPPSGIRRMSLSVFDRLVAIAAELINKALLSDFINYEIADIRLSMLPSGRLGTNQPAYMIARDQYMASFLFSDIESAYGQFPRNWPTPSQDTNEQTKELALIDMGFEAEFGFTLTELTTFLSEIMALGTEQTGPAKRLIRDQLVTRLYGNLSWAPERVNKAVSLFSLEPRGDFLQVPQGYSKEDVYPWRFNRRLSLMRRPLVIAMEGDTEVVWWGNRQVSQSCLYLFTIFWSARLKATSNQMRVAMSKIRNQVTKRIRS